MNTFELVKYSIKLLNASPVFSNEKFSLNKEFYIKALESGIYVNPTVLEQLSSNDQKVLITQELISKYGITSEELQATFLKTFKKSEDMSENEMLFHQFLHYASTYGGIDILKNDGEVYTPEQINQINETEEFIDNEFKKINILKDEEFLNKLNTLMESVMPFSSDDIAMIESLFYYANSKFGMTLPESIGNKELRVKLQQKVLIDSGYKEVPRQAADFIRLIVSEVTGSTLVVKNVQTINQIKMYMSCTEQYKGKPLETMLTSYNEKYGLVELAKSFNRYKPIYLAMKKEKSENINKIINKIAKLSKTKHNPMSLDVLGNAVQYLKQSENKLGATMIIIEKVKTAETYQLIKLFNVLQLKSKQIENEQSEVASLYRVRNGKTFVTTKDVTLSKDYIQYFDLIKTAIISQIKLSLPHLNDYVYILPSNIEYAMPTSTKSFIGELIPNMSRLSVEGNFSVGIHWTTEADIDLSGHNFKTGEYISWHSGHKGDDMIYSGDMTHLDRTGNAHESIFVKYTVKDPLVFSQVLFHGHDYNSSHVDAKLIISEGVNYDTYQSAKQAKVVLPFNAADMASNFILTLPGEKETDVVFTNVTNGSRVVADKNLSEVSYNAVKEKIENSLTVRKFLEMIGATVLTSDEIEKFKENEEETRKIKDFSLNKVSKEDFIKLLKKEA